VFSVFGGTLTAIDEQRRRQKDGSDVRSTLYCHGNRCLRSCISYGIPWTSIVGAPLLDVHTAYPTPWQCSQQLDCLTDLSSEKQVCHMGLPHRVPAKQTSRRLGIAPVIDVGQLSVNKFPITRRKSTDDDPHTTPTAPLSSAVRAVHHFVTSNSLL